MGKSPYWEAQAKVEQAHEVRVKLAERHEREMRDAQAAVDEAVEELRHLKAGTPPEVKEAAEKVIAIRYPHNVHIEDGPSAVRDAIRDLMNGGTKLQHRYIGTKHYDAWPGQREDHKYGFGPRHGSIIFAIELNDDVRKRLLDGGALSEAEIEACVHYLTNLPKAEDQ